MFLSGEVRYTSAVKRSLFAHTHYGAFEGTGWAGGDTNTSPTSQTSVSSFDAMDQILRYFDNKNLYPNLNQIVVAGK
jgi:hypothetical protein